MGSCSRGSRRRTEIRPVSNPVGVFDAGEETAGAELSAGDVAADIVRVVPLESISGPDVPGNDVVSESRRKPIATGGVIQSMAAASDRYSGEITPNG